VKLESREPLIYLLDQLNKTSPNTKHQVMNGIYLFPFHPFHPYHLGPKINNSFGLDPVPSIKYPQPI
jgi:hypothetical protein